MEHTSSLLRDQGASSTLALFILLLIVDSLHFIFVRAFAPYFDPAVSAMYVMVIASAEVGLYIVVRRRLNLDVIRRHFWFFAVIGALVGASTILSYGSVEFISPGAASMLAKMSTLFSLGFGLYWLRERLTTVQVGGACLSFVGVLIITFAPGDFLRVGALMVIASTLLYALHTAIVKRWGEIDLLNFFFMRVLFTALFLVFYVFARTPVTVPTPRMWWLLLVAGTVDVVISRTLFYIALRRLTMSMHAIILTLSPVATVLWSIALFDSVPRPQELIGGIAVLAGVVIAVLPTERSSS